MVVDGMDGRLCEVNRGDLLSIGDPLQIVKRWTATGVRARILAKKPGKSGWSEGMGRKVDAWEIGRRKNNRR
jgi:hypothetical protein